MMNVLEEKHEYTAEIELLKTKRVWTTKAGEEVMEDLTSSTVRSNADFQLS
jgi:hypothetical protein